MNKFTLPKIISPYYSINRIPRKLKKKVKNFCGCFYSLLNYNERMWYYLEKTNKYYKQFLINQISKEYGN